VEEVEAEVEQARRQRVPIDLDVLLRQVPAPGPYQQRGHLVLQTVLLPLVRRQLDGAPHRILTVALAGDHVLPRGRQRILEIRHEHVRARVERVDHHLPLHGPRDLHDPLAQVRRRVGHAPVPRPHLPRLVQEIGHLAALDPLGTGLPLEEQLPTPRLEPIVEIAQEAQRFGGEDSVGIGQLGTAYRDAVWGGVGHGCRRLPFL
jgi:hypothetical protein